MRHLLRRGGQGAVRRPQAWTVSGHRPTPATIIPVICTEPFALCLLCLLRIVPLSACCWLLALPSHRDDETQRVMDAGGFVMAGRVMGKLAVSRAFGDRSFKVPGAANMEGCTEAVVTATPEILMHNIQGRDEFILLACDGLWDVMSSQQAVDFVRERLGAGESLQQTSEVGVVLGRGFGA
jgi:hypothetical protein